MNRRDFLTGTLAGALALPTLADATTTSAAKPLARFAFITDTHLRPTDNAMKWVEVAIKKIASLKPDFVIHGGDLLDTAEKQSVAECEAVLASWHKIADPTRLKVFHTLGNHDLAAMTGSKQDLTNPLSGKGFFKSKISGSNTYYSVDKGTFLIIVLDTVGIPDTGGFMGHVDKEQLDWLKKTLDATPKAKPIIISGHIPIFSLVPEYDSGSDQPISSGLVVINGKEVFEIIKEHNVLAVLQGHTHSIEDLRYIKTKYITGGAICGNWWKGKRFGVHEPGFAMVEVHSDRAEWTYHTYGWTE